MTIPTTVSAHVASAALPDHRIHDFASFNQMTGDGHEVAGLYFYQQLDCLVDLAYKVSCDFFKPAAPLCQGRRAQRGRWLSCMHATAPMRHFPPTHSGTQSSFRFSEAEGSARFPQGYPPTEETGDFPALRDDLLKAAQAFAERQSDTGVDMLRERVKDAQIPMAEYLNGLEGDSIRWSRFNALPTLTKTSLPDPSKRWDRHRLRNPATVRGLPLR